MVRLEFLPTLYLVSPHPPTPGGSPTPAQPNSATERSGSKPEAAPRGTPSETDADDAYETVPDRISDFTSLIPPRRVLGR